jgi:hypothetical protein
MAEMPDGVTMTGDRRVLRAPTDGAHVDRDVARVAAVAARSGVAVRDVALTGASLQDVFISLTGRELRE